MYTLAVIDMQDHFLNRFIDQNKSYHKVLNKCKKQVSKAIKDKANILFVEYDGYGNTTEELVKLTKDADYHACYATKEDDNGGTEIADTIKSLKLKRSKIRICGINTEFCVQATVRGLLSEMKHATIEVISEACDSPWDHKGGVVELEEMSEHFPKLKVK